MKDKRESLLQFFKVNYIGYQEVKKNEYKVYWHDWIELSDMLEREINNG